MKSEKLATALNTCASMLASSGFVVIYAGLFANHVRQNRGVLHQVLLRNLIGQPSSAVPQCAPLGLRGPSREQVVRHIESILDNRDVMGNVKNLPKRARWAGFAAGAAAAIGLTPAYMVTTNPSGAISFSLALFVANDPDSPDHLLAHFMLGYMQGWLWALGHASIDDFRRMNMPDDEPFKSEARAS